MNGRVLITSTLEKTFALLPRSKYRRWEVLTRELGDVEGARDLTTVEICLHDVPWRERGMLKDINPSLDVSQLRGRFISPNRCTVASLDGVPVFYRWCLVNSDDEELSLREATHMHVHVSLPPKWIYLWDGWTREGFRGKGIQPAATALMLAKARGLGLTRALTVVGTGNVSSLKAFQKGGFRQEATLHHLVLIGCEILCGSYRPAGNGR